MSGTGAVRAGGGSRWLQWRTGACGGRGSSRCTRGERARPPGAGSTPGTGSIPAATNLGTSPEHPRAPGSHSRPAGLEQPREPGTPPEPGVPRESGSNSGDREHPQRPQPSGTIPTRGRSGWSRKAIGRDWGSGGSQIRSPNRGGFAAGPGTAESSISRRSSLSWTTETLPLVLSLVLSLVFLSTNLSAAYGKT